MLLILDPPTLPRPGQDVGEAPNRYSDYEEGHQPNADTVNEVLVLKQCIRRQQPKDQNSHNRRALIGESAVASLPV
jgi:hypothetical protein